MKISKEIKAILASVTKIYVGELVEESKQIQLEEIKKLGIDLDDKVDPGPILPF